MAVLNEAERRLPKIPSIVPSSSAIIHSDELLSMSDTLVNDGFFEGYKNNLQPEMTLPIKMIGNVCLIVLPKPMSVPPAFNRSLDLQAIRETPRRAHRDGLRKKRISLLHKILARLPP
jgi:hypothetical protein